MAVLASFGSLRRTTFACVLSFVAVVTAGAQRQSVILNDTEVAPESLTSSRDGAIFFGSTMKGHIYRAAPNAGAADPWIQASTAGLQRVLGVLADDTSHTLWVCSSAPMLPPDAPPSAPPSGETGVKRFNLATGTLEGSTTFPDGRGLCNDIAVSTDGTLYATDTRGARLLRLKPGAATMDLWLADPLLTSVDGIAILGDGTIYVNTFSTGTLVKIAVNDDGTAAAPVKLDTSRALVRPDGMRTVGNRVMLLVEGDGHLDEVTIQGTRAEIKTLKDGFMNPTAVTLVGDQAYVLEGRVKATAVLYVPSR